MSSGSGGTRLDQTSSPSGLGRLRLARGDVAEAPRGGGADGQRQRPDRDRRRAGGGDDPDPGQRQRSARELGALRPLLEQQDGEADGERGLQLEHEAGQAGGHALVDAEEEQAELAGREEDADGDDVLGRHAGAGDEGEGEGDEAEAQPREQQRRKVVETDVDDDEVDAPHDRDDKCEEDMAAGHGPTVTTLTLKSDWTLWRGPVRCASWSTFAACAPSGPSPTTGRSPQPPTRCI